MLIFWAIFLSFAYSLNSITQHDFFVLRRNVPNYALYITTRLKAYCNLDYAVILRSFVDVKRLLASGINPNSQDSNGTTPLHLAAQLDARDIAKLLLDHGANPNIKNNTGLTPLSMAVLGNKFDITKLLLEKGADPNIPDTTNVTPLHLAVKANYPVLITLLLEHGANPNIKENDGFTPLHTAVMWKESAIAKLLLEKGADPNIQEESKGMTPLHIAAFSYMWGIMEFLLAHGADPTIKTKDGHSALHSLLRAPDVYLPLIDAYFKYNWKLKLDDNDYQKIKEEFGTGSLFSVNYGDELVIALQAKDRQAAEKIVTEWLQVNWRKRDNKI